MNQSNEPVTPLDDFCQLPQYALSPSSASFEAGFDGLNDDYFLRDFTTQKPRTSKRTSDGVQNGQLINQYNNSYQQQYQQQHQQQYQPLSNRNWSLPPASATSPPAPRRLHDYSSRASSALTNRNLSYTSSSTPGSFQQASQDFPFYSNAVNPQNISSTQSPLDSLPKESLWDDDGTADFYQDMTPAQNFADATTKRTRAEGRSDAISACWTSPLCPDRTNPRDGTPPNPATCGGRCAPFLFGEEPLPDGINDAALDLPMVSVDQVTIVSRSRAEQQQQHQQSQQQDEKMEQQQMEQQQMDQQQMDQQQMDQQQMEQQQMEQQQMDQQQMDQQQMDQQQDPQPSKPKVQRVSKRADADTKHEDQGRTLSKATNSNLKKSSSTEVTRKAARQPHKKVEQKYRDSINNQMEALRKVVPALSETARACMDDADIEDLPIPSKPSKAVILASATAYIKAQTKEKRQMEAENAALRQQVLALQALMGNKCDECSLMQRAVGMNLRAGPTTDQWPMTF
ncbi:hypothetical protein E6O75_ATG01465 [Venturia nashicola]|uniref:BHLH domain-containing protein n=1 Tax=Venturia nashicola TaxID=86259 RepID=A0A4Z1PC90_9PEZI|nr:hypothetical protein E6O75_ATG01465 [Venturia nashicola]